MGTLRQAFDYLVIVFFITHIPITLFVDSQGLFNRSMYPRLAADMLDDFIRDFKDPLMTQPLAPWFASLVWTEVLLQLPFFFVGAFAWIYRKNWIRIPAIIYGTSVCTTMVPILYVLATHSEPGYSPAALVGFYLPYLVVPFLIVAVMAASPVPFPKTNKTAFKPKIK